MKTQVISAFPGCGKTYCYNNLKNRFKILDSDSSQFSWLRDEKGINTNQRNLEFPEICINYIKHNLGKVDIIFVSSHKVVRDALRKNNIEYTLVYPNILALDIFKERFLNRGDDDDFIKFISDNWVDFIDEMDNETFPNKIKLYDKNNYEYINEDLLNMIMDEASSIYCKSCKHFDVCKYVAKFAATSVMLGDMNIDPIFRVHLECAHNK